jgi:hypothetical protein
VCVSTYDYNTIMCWHTSADRRFLYTVVYKNRAGSWGSSCMLAHVGCLGIWVSASVWVCKFAGTCGSTCRSATGLLQVCCGSIADLTSLSLALPLLPTISIATISPLYLSMHSGFVRLLRVHPALNKDAVFLNRNLRH